MRVPRFDSANILVVGDAMLDRYWHGETKRVSAEAPIPVVDIKDIEDLPGGAANVALNLLTLGARSSLVAAAGYDEAGEILIARLQAAGVDCQFIRSKQLKTTTKLRIVSQNQQLIRADFEEKMLLDAADIVAKMAPAISSCDSVLISDYDKGLIEDAKQIIALAKRANKPVLVDPKFKDLSAYRGATIIKPNRLELEKTLGCWSSEVEMVVLCQQAISALDIEAMLVTRAAEGMTLIRKGLDEVHFPARTREVYDVSGAGDTVIATLAAALASGESMVDATGLANVAAGIVVGHFGVAGVSGPELRLEVSSQLGLDRGVMSQEQLLIAAEEARSRDQKIVFTNGCFDILHAGHVDYLTEAKAEGDLLVVGVNDDDSVRRLKGDARPINSLDRRMTLLAGLQAVDWVVGFSDDTPEDLLKALRPEVLVKGGDYSVDQVVGADIVRAYDGAVKVLKLVEDCSTSALVQKIREL